MKNIYDRRLEILAEPISANAHRCKGLRIRSKIPRQQKLFEDRLAQVLLEFSSKINLNVSSIADIAQDRIYYFILHVL